MIGGRPAALRWPGVPRLADGLAAVLLLALCTAALDGVPLFDVDEGAFAEASREMLMSGDWGHTTLNGADRFDKPILVYWLQAMSLAMLGVSEAAVRLPSALCAWGWCLAVASFAGARWGRRTGWTAAAMLATGLGPMLIGRAATADSLLNLLLALTLLDLWRWTEAADEPAARRAWRRACLWVGLGLLAKGPVSVVVAGGALLLWAATGGRPAWRQLARGLRDGVGWSLLVVTALPWYAYALARHGRAFIDGFLWHHNVERFAGALEGHAGSSFYHLGVLPLLLLPWTPLLAVVLVRVLAPLLQSLLQSLLQQPRRSPVDPSLRWPLAWAGFVLVFFSLAATKLPHYALYGVTPLVLLMARQACSDSPHRGVMAAVVVAAMALVVVGAATVPVAHAWATSVGAGEHWQQRLMDAAAGPGPSSGLAPLLLLGLATALACAWFRPAWQLPVMIASAGTAAAWWLAMVVPFWGHLLQGPVQALALDARQRGVPLVQWNLHQPSAGFYRGEAAPRRPPAPGEAALLRSDRLEAAQAQTDLSLRVLQQVPGFVLVQATPP